MKKTLNALTTKLAERVKLFLNIPAALIPKSNNETFEKNHVRALGRTDRHDASTVSLRASRLTEVALTFLVAASVAYLPCAQADATGVADPPVNGGEEFVSVQAAYPVIKTSARCIHEGDYLHPAIQMLDHTMTVKVEPSYVGDPNEEYEKNEIWKAMTKAEIRRTRPLGKTCVGRDWRFGWCKHKVFNPVNDVFTDNRNVTVKANVYVKVDGRWEVKIEVKLNIKGKDITPQAGFQSGYNMYPHKIAWWTGSSRSVTSDVLRGAGVPEATCSYRSPLEAVTKGTAAAKWLPSQTEVKLDVHGNPVTVEVYAISLGRKETEDPAKVTHTSPDQSCVNDTCTNTFVKILSPVPY